MPTPTVPATAQERFLGSAGHILQRYGLVLVLAWIGAMKFTAYEAAGIQPLILTSPLTRWMYNVWSVQALSNVIGVVELVTAALIAARPFSAKLATIGSALAIPTFLTTLSFLFTLPGWESTLGGFPALSGSGGFLLKDVVLLGVAVSSLSESLAAMRPHEEKPSRRPPNSSESPSITVHPRS